jgi:hypothetical protein
MLDISPNPFADPIKNFIKDLRATKWQFPYILQAIHSAISAILLIILLVLYATVGIVAQISNSFWDLITGIGQKMSFSSPIESSFYAISATIYFIIFLPFFILQLPIWFGGWFASKIGIKPLIIILGAVIIGIGVYFFVPQLPTKTIAQIVKIQDSIKKEYFSNDSLKVQTNILDLENKQPENLKSKNNVKVVKK